MMQLRSRQNALSVHYYAGVCYDVVNYRLSMWCHESPACGFCRAATLAAISARRRSGESQCIRYSILELTRFVVFRDIHPPTICPLLVLQMRHRCFSRHLAKYQMAETNLARISLPPFGASHRRPSAPMRNYPSSHVVEIANGDRFVAILIVSLGLTRIVVLPSACTTSTFGSRHLARF